MSLAPGIKLFNRCLPPWTHLSGKVLIFALTFWIYTCYHLSRKPISVVKSVLHANCTESAERAHTIISAKNATFCDWKPFDGDNYNALFGALDLAFLCTYSVGVFISGHLADHFNLRYFITIGSLLSGVTTIAFGLGYFFEIHSFAFYVIVQLLAGFTQATGWPAVVACMGNWFGKSGRGFFMGVWTAHASLGNILGSLVAGAFVATNWGWSFVVPGLMISATGVLTFLFLVPYPEELGLESPSRALEVKASDPSPPSVSLDGSSEPPENTEDATLRCRFSSREDLVNLSETSSTLQLRTHHPVVAETHAVSFLDALRVPGVVEYSLSLFFSKLVAYTFLFWLPNYIREAGGFDPTQAADLSAIFDVGGIIGGILAGAISDYTGASASVCVGMLILGAPMLYLYSLYGTISALSCSLLLIPLGLLVNGPYALITTAVSADLGTHPALQSNARALATVSGIIDGTGSVGSAFGPLLCGVLKSHGWGAVIAMLITSLILAALLLLRRVSKEIGLCVRIRHRPLIEEPVV